MILHDAMPGFRAGRGTGIATLEAKLFQKLAGVSHKPLFQVFLYVRKAYDSLDRGRCMEILRGYGIGQNTVRLISHHWDSLIFVPKVRRFLGTSFVMERVSMQGYPLYPIIFNIVVDTVVRVVLEVVCGLQEARQGVG